MNKPSGAGGLQHECGYFPTGGNSERFAVIVGSAPKHSAVSAAQIVPFVHLRGAVLIGTEQELEGRRTNGELLSRYAWALLSFLTVVRCAFYRLVVGLGEAIVTAAAGKECSARALSNR